MRFSVALLLFFLSACDWNTPAESAKVSFVSLDDEARQLREEFNRSKGKVRLLFIVDPSCSACLRGLDDMNRDLLAQTRDSRLQTYVVHVPVIGAKAKHVQPAATLLPAENVRHYWNESGKVGWTLSNIFGIKNNKGAVYAWDVWLLFGADADWPSDGAPKAQVIMHQLEELEGTEFPPLDTKVFAQKVHAMLSNTKTLDAGQ